MAQCMKASHRVSIVLPRNIVTFTDTHLHPPYVAVTKINMCSTQIYQHWKHYCNFSTAEKKYCASCTYHPLPTQVQN